MLDDKTHINEFMKDLFEDNYAKAKEDLQSAIVEKLKTRMKGQMLEGHQPKTGAKCSCKKGKERDNCRKCEGTGEVVDFKAIRAKTKSKQEKGDK